MQNRRIGAITLGCWMLVALGLWAAPAAGKPSDGRSSLERKLSYQEVRKHAQKIDQLLKAGWRERGERGNPQLKDAEFVRRVYLDIAGRIPTFREALSFLRSNNRNKRRQLIDDLLESPSYVSHAYNYFADLLRIKSELTNNVPGKPYAKYIKRSLHENKPYDKLVYELLTAKGRLYENGANGYFFRDSGMPLCNTSNTTRVFLGTRVGCAQCHDHPFDKWAQKEFFEMAAYTYGTRTRVSSGNLGRAYQMARQQVYDKGEEGERSRADRRLVGYLRQLSRRYAYKVHETDRQVKLPRNYKYSDGKPGEIVEPFTIFGNIPEPKEGQSRREAYAEWLTSEENPRFATVIANRLWKRAFGRGLIEPVDKLTDGTEPVYPELMTYLTQLMKDLDFDMKQYLRVLYNTRAYQREATRKELAEDERFAFTGPMLRRMSASQMWDSMLSLSVPKLDERLDYEKLTVASLDEQQNPYERYVGKSPERIIELAREHIENSEDSGGSMMGMMGRYDYERGKARASELRQPAPAGHLLRRFGQSDRELIQNGNRQPAVTQVLTLMNGPIDEVLLKDRSVLYENVKSASGVEQKLDVIWISILSRRPDRFEKQTALAEVQNNEDMQAFKNLVWALLNTREFMFIR